MSTKKFLLSVFVISLLTVFCIPFVVLAGTVSSLDVTMTGYELGNTPNDVSVTLNNSNIQMVGFAFSYGNAATPMEETDEFDGGYGYRISVYIKPKNSDTDISQLTAVKIKLNGEVADYYYLNRSNPYYGCYKILVYLNEFKTDDYRVSIEGGTAKVNGKVVTRAKAGDTVNVSLDGGTSLGNKYFIEWWCSNNSLSTDKESFSFTMPSNSISFIAKFGVLIKELPLTGLVAPVAGEAPKVDLKLSKKNDIYYNNSKDRYGIKYVNAIWYEDIDGYDPVEVEGTFKYDTKYILNISIEPETTENFFFDETTKNNITIDGKKVTSSNITDAREIVVKMHFNYKTEKDPNASSSNTEASDNKITCGFEIREKSSGKSIGGQASLSTDLGTNGLKTNGYSMSATKDTIVVLKAVPDNGYKFLGWYVEENGKSIRTTETKDFTFEAKEDVNYIAMFESISTHNVIFETNGGSKVDTQNVADKGKATKPATPTKSGFDFEGWYLDKELTKGYNFLQEVTTDITLYAKWVETKANESNKQEQSGQTQQSQTQQAQPQQEQETLYEVSFETNGGSKVEVQKVKKGSKLAQPTNLTKEGFEFGGWYTDKELTKAFDFTKEVTGNIKLFAKWLEVKKEAEKEVWYVAEFETNGGTKIEELDVKKGDKVTKPDNPTKNGYVFDGWYTTKTLKKEYDFETPVTDDVVLYAKWSEVKQEETQKGTETVSSNQKIVWASVSSWAIDELDKANENGMIPEIFNKQDLTLNITRKEFAHVAVRLYEKITGKKATTSANNPFVDTSDAEVLKAFNLGITNGTSETTFDPDELITREQMATMMTRALSKAEINTEVDIEKVAKFADDAEMHDWGKSSIYYMSNIGIIKGMGDNLFGVLGNATREQALLISERSVEKFSK